MESLWKQQVFLFPASSKSNLLIWNNFLTIHAIKNQNAESAGVLIKHTSWWLFWNLINENQIQWRTDFFLEKSHIQTWFWALLNMVREEDSKAMTDRSNSVGRFQRVLKEITTLSWKCSYILEKSLGMFNISSTMCTD